MRGPPLVWQLNVATFSMHLHFVADVALAQRLVLTVDGRHLWAALGVAGRGLAGLLAPHPGRVLQPATGRQQVSRVIGVVRTDMRVLWRWRWRHGWRWHRDGRRLRDIAVVMHLLGSVERWRAAGRRHVARRWGGAPLAPQAVAEAGAGARVAGT